MKTGTPSDESRDFFDRQSSENRYGELKAKLHVQDEMGARMLNGEVSGDALVVGGVWDCFEWRPRLKALTVLDTSPGMLKDYAPEGSIPVLGDVFQHEFAPESFDTVVFPLMLHHTAERGWSCSQGRIVEALQRARRWLRPSGRILIMEHCPHPAWSPLQRVALPATKLFMKAIGQPLVVLQTKEFFERTVTATFGACYSTRLAPNGLKPWTLLPVFLGASWVQLPFALYPKAYVFSAIKR